MRQDLTLMQVQAVIAHLRDQLGEEPDEQLLVDSLEGETDLFELVARLLNNIEADEGVQSALSDQIADRTARKQRATKRIEIHREAIMALMECASLEKLALPEATLSLRRVPPRLAVNDPQGVPEEYTVPNPKPDLEAIKAAFTPDDVLPNWLRCEPERMSLTVRRK